MGYQYPPPRPVPRNVTIAAPARTEVGATCKSVSIPDTAVAGLNSVLEQHWAAEAGEIVAKLDAIKDEYRIFIGQMPTILVASSSDTKIAHREFRAMNDQDRGKQTLFDGVLGIFGVSRPQPTPMIRTAAIPLPAARGDNMDLRYMVGIVDNGDGGERAQLYERNPDELSGNRFFYTTVDPYEIRSVAEMSRIQTALSNPESIRIWGQGGLTYGDSLMQTFSPVSNNPSLSGIRKAK